MNKDKIIEYTRKLVYLLKQDRLFYKIEREQNIDLFKILDNFEHVYSTLEKFHSYNSATTMFLSNKTLLGIIPSSNYHNSKMYELVSNMFSANYIGRNYTMGVYNGVLYRYQEDIKEIIGFRLQDFFILFKNIKYSNVFIKYIMDSEDVQLIWLKELKYSRFILNLQQIAESLQMDKEELVKEVFLYPEIKTYLDE